MFFFRLSVLLPLLYAGMTSSAALEPRHKNSHDTTTTTSSTSSSSTAISIVTSTRSPSSSAVSIATSTRSSSTASASITSSSNTIASSSGSTTASSTATATAPIIPNNSGCNLPQLTITNFFWFNSTHNLDCGGSGPDVGDGTVCLPGSTDCGIAVCSTGIPNLFLPGGPPGYGPPDHVVMNISNYNICDNTQDITIPYRRIGDGSNLRCGGAGYAPTFSGNSNIANGTATVTVGDFQQACVINGKTVAKQAVAQFVLNCSYDAGRNATCVSNQASVPMVWQLV